MKNLVTLILMMYSINSFSQTINPDLYQTRYLYSYGSTDDHIFYPASDVTPPISPSITFTPTLDFYGDGACNSFTGTFSSPFDGTLQFNNFASTLLICSSSEQTGYEGGYFSLMQFNGGGQYFVSGSGDDMGLFIETPIFVNYIFGNSPLHAPTFDLKQTVLYPNPMDTKLYIDSQNNTINKIEIFNGLGQTVTSASGGFDFIDTSGFASGVYLVKLYSEDKTVIKKIVKK